MGPSRYNHLIAFQPGRRVERAAAVLMKKETIGGNATRENLSRDSTDTEPYSHRASPYQHALYLSAAPDARQTARGALQENFRVISTARLRTLPPVHLPPINVVVSNDPKWRSYLEVGFVLRCFQHLSVPDAATRPCPWRDNRLAGGRSNTVLSY